MRPAYSSILVISLGLLFSSLGAQSATVKPPSSAVEVAYLLVGTTVYTYDVDPTTGNATEEGSGITLDSVSNTVFLHSSNDHFIYVTGDDSSNVQWLWVYKTDSTGTPQLPAVQALNLTDGGFTTYDFVLNSAGTLAYAAEWMYSKQGYMLAKVSEFTVDPNAGMVTKSPTAAAEYKQNGPCLLTAEAFFYIYGFNPAGNVLYDIWDCNYPYGNNSANYYRRLVNTATGALGRDNLFFSWADGNQGLDAVTITPNSLVYFSIPSYLNNGMGSLNLYSLSSSQQFSCTDAMLQACGYGLWNFVDPTGKFDLIEVAPDLTEITKIEPAAKKLANTNNYIQGYFVGFSPDDALIYTQQANQPDPWVYPIYLFDPSTGAVTYMGGEIVDYSDGGTLIPALLQ
jgi:hypothetical protein